MRSSKPPSENIHAKAGPTSPPAFIARGLASGERARMFGGYVPATQVIDKLTARLAQATRERAR